MHNKLSIIFFPKSMLQNIPVTVVCKLKLFFFFTVQVTSALGATYLGAERAGYDLPRDYTKNVFTIYTHVQTPISSHSPCVQKKQHAPTSISTDHITGKANGTTNGKMMNGGTNGTSSSTLNGKANGPQTTTTCENTT